MGNTSFDFNTDYLADFQSMVEFEEQFFIPNYNELFVLTLHKTEAGFVELETLEQ